MTTATTPPKPSARTAQALREALEDDIAVGLYPPGTRLDEVSLAKRFSVSRTPIREALIELSASGLVEIRPRRGAFVREIGIPRLIEMFEVMAELEAMCARLATRRMDGSERAALLEAHERCAAAAGAGDPDAYYIANEDFHDAIYRGSGNGFLEERARDLKNRLKPYRRLQLRVRNRVGNSLAEHQALVDAIQAGDAETASAVLRSHILIQGERFNDFVASLAAAEQTRRKQG
ncbi:GntR family transcriptional regulator [Stappia sp. ES.058]|uniref:GntR family transcriptional regulator n=1 Tax=Stappia sp. ES.058 TaxID=1881061 RepID=UPI00087AD902|nr:GntR family transcriptional regulator [Stappia sp. ES.058]SDT95793.1 DNA-binding transcriptional regulator, GntR family [Stappia sp. ES.058]